MVANGRYSSSTAFKNLFHLVSTSLTYSKTFSALPNKPSVVYQPPNDYHKTHCRFMGQKGQHKIRNYASVKGIKTVNVTKIKRPPARLKRQEQDMFLPEWSLLYNCSHPTQWCDDWSRLTRVNTLQTCEISLTFSQLMTLLPTCVADFEHVFLSVLLVHYKRNCKMFQNDATKSSFKMAT